MAHSYSGRPYRRARAALKAMGLPCHLCGREIDPDLPPTHRLSFTVDHALPVSRGGTDEVSNLRPSHRACNSAKRDRLGIKLTGASRRW